MRYIAMLRHGPNWKRGRSVYQQGAPIVAHLTKTRERHDEGSLLLGGPFEEDGSGGIAVLDVDDEASAVAFMQADPAVIAGVLAYELHLLHASSTPSPACAPSRRWPTWPRFGPPDCPATRALRATSGGSCSTIRGDAGESDNQVRLVGI